MIKFEIAPKSTEIELNWYDAKLYCFSLNVDGITGWRLPTIEELEAIHKSDNDFGFNWYWSADESSSTHAFNYGWFGKGRNGSAAVNNKNMYGYRVRAVRSKNDNL